jgi:hypothetical protein
MSFYKTTRRFTDGPLKGTTYTEVSTVKFPVGFNCPNPVGGSPYTIVSCTTVYQQETDFISDADGGL